MDNNMRYKKSNMITEEGYFFKSVDEYLSLKFKSTNSWIMVSEFIDNSISSFENEYGDDCLNWDRKLEITLNYYINDKHTAKGIAGKEVCNYYKDVSFCIIDNAFGINFDRLQPALLYGLIDDTTKSKKNRFGKGLKHAIFYFGMDLDIFTSSVEGNSKISVKCSKLKFPEKEKMKATPYEWDKNKGTEGIPELGTKIVINSIYEKKIISEFSSNTRDTFMDSLSGRYGKYVKEGKLSITLKSSNSITKKIFTPLKVGVPLIENNNFRAPVSSIIDSNYWGTDREKSINDFINALDNINDDIENKADNMEDSRFDPKVAKETLSKFKDMVCLENWDEKVVWSQNYKLPNDKYENNFFEIEFFKINADKYKSFSQWSGITIYEGQRPIRHGPQGTYKKEWFAKSQSTGSTDNIFCGSFDLLDIDSKKKFVKDDKSNFQIDEQDEIDAFIYSIWWCFDKIILLGRSNSQTSFFDPKKEGKNLILNLSKQRDSVNYVNGTIVIKKSENPNGNEEGGFMEADLNDVKSAKIINYNDQWNIFLIPDYSNKFKNAKRNTKIISDIEFKNEEEGIRSLYIRYYPYSNLFKLTAKYSNKESNIYGPFLANLGFSLIDLRLEWEEEENNDLNNRKSIDSKIADFF